MSRRSTVSTESTNTQNTNIQSQEDTMNAQNTNANTKFFTVTVASGRKIQIPEETVYLILGVTKTALNEYTRKASETTIGKTNPKPKDPNAVKYDTNMLFRMQVMSAFITKVLEGITIPEKDNATVIDQLNSL